MASRSTDGPRIDWEAVGKVTNLDDVVRAIPPERVVKLLGEELAIRTIGLDRVIEAVGLPRFIESSGAEKVLDELLKHLSPEQLQEMLRRRQQG